MDEAEIAGPYIRQQKCSVERPYKELKGFSKVLLKKGESKTVSISLDSSAFAYYKTDLKKFAFDTGTFDILIGSSSKDILLKGSIAKTEDDKN